MLWEYKSHMQMPVNRIFPSIALGQDGPTLPKILVELAAPMFLPPLMHDFIAPSADRFRYVAPLVPPSIAPENACGLLALPAIDVVELFRVYNTAE